MARKKRYADNDNDTQEEVVELTEEKSTSEHEETSRKRQPRNNVAADPTAIEFKAWFLNELGLDSRLKLHHMEQIRLFMKGLGLSEKENPSKYRMGLKTYFGE